MEEDLLVVSIWCITYNQAPYIRECLDGIVMQKCKFRIEAIVHDDASTDGTADIVMEYANKYPDIIKPILESENQWSKHDGSLERIMQKECRGKYIAICEGDDYWTNPNKLQVQVNYLETHSDCSCYVQEYDEWLQNKGTMRTHSFNCLKGRDVIDFDNHSFSKYVFVAKTLTSVFRRTSLESSNYYQYAVRFDMPMFYALSTQGYIHLTNERMGVYRVCDSGVTAGGNLGTFNRNTQVGLFSICQIENSDSAREFVYHCVREYILSFVLNNHQLLFLCFSNLGIKINCRLLFKDLPRLVFEIVKKKFSRDDS